MISINIWLWFVMIIHTRQQEKKLTVWSQSDHHRCTNETDSIRSRTSYGTFLGDGSDQWRNHCNVRESAWGKKFRRSRCCSAWIWYNVNLWKTFKSLSLYHKGNRILTEWDRNCGRQIIYRYCSCWSQRCYNEI